MDKVAITKLNLSKNNVTINEKITIQVFASSVMTEPANERLAFVLGGTKPKG